MATVLVRRTPLRVVKSVLAKKVYGGEQVQLQPFLRRSVITFTHRPL